ncbi:MAG: 4-hydroxy-tetrahydrodipicolinate synthase [Gammaproteobacteria bacterium]|nr:4-hydroxy-tetrahydrodipicolinate synthase [Gammaproteobacteria bacterium]
MIKGSIVAIATPMHEDGSLDLVALSSLLQWHVEKGTDGIVAVGTTGESPTLSVEEDCTVISHVVQEINGRVPVIAGTGANSTTEAIELTKAAKKAGADACLLVTPYYNKPNQRGLVAHYTKIAESVDIPQILYNVPSRTACDMLPDTIQILSEVPNIVGVKEATGDIGRGKEVMQLCGDDFAVYSGDDATSLELILAGAVGTISVTANVAPDQVHEMCRLAMAGENEAAGKINDKIACLHELLFLEANPMPVKWALKEMGLIGPGIRLPMVELDAMYHEQLQQALHASGAIQD